MFTQLFNRLPTIICLSTSLLFFSETTFGQCSVEILNTTADTLEIPCGTSVQLERDNLGSIPLSDMFNGSTSIGMWHTLSGGQLDNPCLPSSGGYLWFGELSANPRALRSNPINLSCGGQVCFDLRLAIQGQSSPCEGPDQPDEGVAFQYSVNNGNTWDTIFYFEPDDNGSFNAASPGSGDYTGWANYCFNIPPAASVGNVEFMWSQQQVTGNTFDHWGIDSIVVTSNCGNVSDVWSTGDTTQFISTGSLQAPVLFFITRISQNGIVLDTCMDSLVVSPTPLEIGLTPNPGIKCFGDSTNVNASVLGGTGQQQYEWSTGQTGNQLQQVPTGNYYITVTDSSGCVSTDSIYLDQPDSIYSVLTTQNISCDSANNGELIATAMGGTPPYVIYWDNSFYGFGPTETFSQLSEGVYLYTIKDLNNCERTDSIVIGNDHISPFIDWNDTVFMCEGSSIQLSAGNSGASYNWSTGETSEVITIQTFGIYSVTVTSAEGCVGKDSIVVSADTCLGTEELEVRDLSIYPNPVSGQLNIAFDSDLTFEEITLYNNGGSIVMQKAVSGVSQLSIDMSIISEGVYFLEIRTDTGAIYRNKIIKM
jgi:hypothetical protein